MSAGNSHDARAVHDAVLRKLGKKKPRLAQALTLVLSLFLFALLGWSTIVQVPGLVRADGELVARGSLSRVEHLDGGIVAEILIKEGQDVARGEVIARLSDEAISLQLEQARLRRRNAAERIYRFNALLADFPTEPTPQSVLPRDAGELRLQQAQSALSVERRRAATQLVRERAGVIKTMRAIRDTTAKRVKGAERRWAAYETLAERGTISRLDLNMRRDELDALQAELLQSESDLSSAISSHIDAQNAYRELMLAEREETLQNLKVAIEEEAELALQVQELELRQSQLTLRSPVDGVVQSVSIGDPGEVVEPGGHIADILPSVDMLVAEMRLSPIDIGQVQVGDNVAINVMTYPRNRYGQVNGQITGMSPTSVETENEDPYFKVTIDLENQFIGLDGEQNPLRAGMTAQAEIVIASRTVAAYLLKPLEATLSTVMTEK